MPTFRALARGLRRRLRGDFRKRFPHVVFGEGVILRGEEKFVAGYGCSVDVRAYLNCAGGAWNNHAGYLHMGDGSEIGAYCVLHGGGGIKIGNNVHIGALTTISAHQLYADTRSGGPMRMEFAPVTIEDDVLIGPASCVTPGVTIGKGAIVGSGSTVSQDVPPGGFVHGVPARVVLQNDGAEAPRATANVSPTTLADLVAELGKMDALSPDEDFYEAGFSSINALTLLMEIERRFGVTIRDEEFVQARTADDLKRLIESSRAG